jgi:hypothetical protein
LIRLPLLLNLFKKIGLQTLTVRKFFKQRFSWPSQKCSIKVLIDGKTMDERDVVSFHMSHKSLWLKSDVQVGVLEINLVPKFYEYYQSGKNLLVPSRCSQIESKSKAHSFCHNVNINNKQMNRHINVLGNQYKWAYSSLQ